EYYLAGRMIAVSVVHGRPAPRFLSRDLIDHICNKPDFNATITDITNNEIRTVLYSKSLDALRTLMRNSAMFQAAGCLRYAVEDRKRIVRDYLRWYIIFRNHFQIQRHISFSSSSPPPPFHTCLRIGRLWEASDLTSLTSVQASASLDLQGGSHHVNQSGPPATLCSFAAPALILPHSRLFYTLSQFGTWLLMLESHTILYALFLSQVPGSVKSRPIGGLTSAPLQKSQTLGTSPFLSPFVSRSSGTVFLIYVFGC
ncbi:G2E3 ligase, partial [Polyodon spathula]|nr:G2E3 ligase [Polyodon spathula]